MVVVHDEGVRWVTLAHQLIRAGAMILGIPKRRTVRLAPHSPAWAEEFRRERDRIVSAVGRLQGIEHVGSTAIPGIHAKPVIDIAAATGSLERIEELAPMMASIGYDCPGDVGIPGERLFGRGPDIRTHLVHVVSSDGPQWRDYLRFRDALRTDQALAKEYDEIKLALANRFPDDRASCTLAKGRFIERVLGGAD